jgi:uncharacterized protein GlcG (DUF336 family)
VFLCWAETTRAINLLEGEDATRHVVVLVQILAFSAAAAFIGDAWEHRTAEFAFAVALGRAAVVAAVTGHRARRTAHAPCHRLLTASSVRRSLSVNNRGDVMPDISAEAAQAVITAVVARATSMGVTSNVAVVDSGCHLKAFLRMNGALLGSADVAIKKARTSGLFNLSTDELAKLTRPGAPLYGIEVTNDGLVTFGDGTPICDGNGVLLGAVGISGSTVEDDTLLAEVGADAAVLEEARIR